MNRFRILWSKFKIKVISKVVNLWASQTNYEINNTVLVIGSTRSGTTFLMESLNEKNEYRVIFEPFNTSYTPEWASFGSRHYIDPDYPQKEEVEAVDKILRGQINNAWVDRYNRKIKSKMRLIKAVRANLLVDYLIAQYPELSIIYIYRNPYKVVASRINLNFDRRDVDSILVHEIFLKKYYSDIDIETLKTFLSCSASCHTALWCLENRFLLEMQNQLCFAVLPYESIVGKTILIEEGVLVKSERKRKPSVASSRQISYQLSPTEIKKIGVVLAYFKMDDFIQKQSIK